MREEKLYSTGKAAKLLGISFINKPIGDTSALLNPESIEELKRKVGCRGEYGQG